MAKYEGSSISTENFSAAKDNKETWWRKRIPRTLSSTRRSMLLSSWIKIEANNDRASDSLKLFDSYSLTYLEAGLKTKGVYNINLNPRPSSHPTCYLPPNHYPLITQ
jgi:hypothetical protein